MEQLTRMVEQLAMEMAQFAVGIEHAFVIPRLARARYQLGCERDKAIHSWVLRFITSLDIQDSNYL
jgi:hypothetical protein